MVNRIAAALMFAALLLGGSTPASLQAQGGAAGRVSGVVADSSTGQPLQSVQLFLSRGTTRLEARTSADGRYLFPSVPAGTYGLEAIRLGYRRVLRANLVVTAGQTLTYDLRMDAAALNLQAVVTTGVVDPTSGTRVPFSVGRVTAEDAPVPATNALETIQGKIAGVSVVPTGQAGSGTNIQLRTPTSISKGNAPLIVVDGVILTQSFDAASADLQSMDIESVEVVKGASAASLYGSRASAGVIQIRTRRGTNVAEGSTRFTVRSE
jgi:TonB-dependent SusC/RagA subfamily outer membrane receptor